MAKILKQASRNNLNVAIIMDGNGRWALSNSLNISKGHQKGVQVVKDIVQESVQQKISSLTLYAFSSENWSRPKAEIEAIKKLVLTAIEDQVPELIEEMVSNSSCVPEDKIDLLIRTGGDKRVSNFLLYQIAYAEIFFIDKFWPDFEKDDFISCINKFNKVSRRFGARI